MDEQEIFTITINLIKGAPLKFKINPTEEKILGVKKDLEQALVRNVLAVELDGKLIMIPYSNIQTIECDPAPPGLPFTILRGALSQTDG